MKHRKIFHRIKIVGKIILYSSFELCFNVVLDVWYILMCSILLIILSQKETIIW